MSNLPEPIWISLQETSDLVLAETGADREGVRRSLIDAFGEMKIETRGQCGSLIGYTLQAPLGFAAWSNARVDWVRGTFHQGPTHEFYEIIVRREHVIRWMGADSTPAGDSRPTPAKDKGGAPPKYDWPAFQKEILRIANTDPDGLPQEGALVKRMLDWCTEEWTKCPVERTIRRKVQEYAGDVIEPLS